ncbi:hypothetical protein HDU93_007595 [Gonapodya sp. JEL0774]|nr:hypothetical protein HDU93_007595 [Gonapodya sp. JEL0774]
MLPSTQVLLLNATFQALEEKALRFEEKALRFEAKVRLVDTEKRLVEWQLREERLCSGFYEFRSVFEQARAKLMIECKLEMDTFRNRPVDLWEAIATSSTTFAKLRTQLLSSHQMWTSTPGGHRALAHDIVHLHESLSSAHHKPVFLRDHVTLVFPTSFLPTSEDRDLATLFYKLRDPGVNVGVGIDIFEELE